MKGEANERVNDSVDIQAIINTATQKSDSTITNQQSSSSINTVNIGLTPQIPNPNLISGIENRIPNPNPTVSTVSTIGQSSTSQGQQQINNSYAQPPIMNSSGQTLATFSQITYQKPISNPSIPSIPIGTRTSCPALKKVYEIIFTKLHFLVLSFKEIQSLR